MAAIRNYPGLPSIQGLKQRLRVKHPNFSMLVQRDPKLAAAWKKKIMSEVRKMTVTELFDSKVVSVLMQARVSEALEHKRRVVLRRIRSFSGRPSLLHLARYVTGAKTGMPQFMGKDPVLRRAAEDRLLSIFKRLSVWQIREQRLDRSAGKISREIGEYVAGKLAAAAAKHKRRPVKD